MDIDRIEEERFWSLYDASMATSRDAAACPECDGRGCEQCDWRGTLDAYNERRIKFPPYPEGDVK